MSSVLASFTVEVSRISAEQLVLERAAMPGLVAALEARSEALAAAAAAAAAAAEKPKRKATKASKASKEAELLAPVDVPVTKITQTLVASPTPITAVVDPTDPLKHHPSRLAKIDTTKCMARKVVSSKWVPGTHKDEGGVKKFHPESQCSSAPVTGNALCTKCLEQEALAIAGKRDSKKWFGRLDQPMYEFAAVVGCKQFMEYYPTGINGDPLSVPPPATTTVVPKAPGAPKKAKKVKMSEDVPAAIAMEALAPVEAEWVAFIQKSGVPAIRNLKTSMVYGVNATETDRAKMAKMDDCLGRWDETKGEVDPYGVPEDDE